MHLFQGKIFWYSVPNRGQAGSKRRPVIIVSSTAEASDPQVSRVICLACSHSSAERDPLPAHCVLLPEKVGKRQTKLGQTTAVVCDWRVEIEKATIVPGDLAGSIGEHVLRAVLETFARYTSPSA